MREIKFRAWDNVQKTWYRGIQRDIIERYNEPSDNDLIVMQFTGLKDKNGVEIYEGDILAREDARVEGEQTEYGQFIVKHSEYEEEVDDYSVEGFGWYGDGYNGYHRASGKDDRYHHTRSIVGIVRQHNVIGNIHETPELLKD